MKRPMLWLAICLLPFTVKSQSNLESKLNSILSDLKSNDEFDFSILPQETEIAGFDKSGSQLTIKLDIPIHFLDRDLDAQIAEEVIEHFAVPMSEFGFLYHFCKSSK